MPDSSRSFYVIASGHLLLILSGVFYSVFWILNETDSAAAPVTSLCISTALLSGLPGIILLAVGIGLTMPERAEGFGIYHIIAAGILFFVTACVVSGVVLKRQFTSELFLIAVWGVLEMCVIYAHDAAGVFQRIQTVVSVILTGGAIAVAMACYEMHYVFEGKMRFYNGLIPYSVIVLVMAVITVFQIKSRNRAGRNDP